MRISDWSSDVCSSDRPLVDDEGASRDARRILDEGADIGIADIQRLLSRNWRSEDKREGGRYFEEMSGHWPCKVRAIGTTAAPRSTIREIRAPRSEEHTSELQSLMRISYAVFCLKKKNT